MTELVRAARPAALPDKISYARALADSGLLPAQYRRQPANLLYAIEYGEAVGISPMAAITGVHVIEGKPTASAALISGLVRRAGHRLRVTGDDRQARAIVIREDDPGFEFESVWTLERAAQAGLCQLRDGRPFARDSKGRALPWEKYPAAMLKARAITEVSRDACEEVLFGLHYTPEELGAAVDAEGEPLDVEVVEAQPVRDFVAEAEAAQDADTVRALYRDAAASGADDAVRARLAEIGRAKAAPPAAEPAADPEIEDAEIVEDSATTDDGDQVPPPGEWGTPPGAEAERATAPQKRKMGACFNELLGSGSDRARRLAITSTIIGRSIPTANDLTKAEAIRLLDALDRMLAADAPAAELAKVEAAATSRAA